MKVLISSVIYIRSDILENYMRLLFVGIVSSVLLIIDIKY